MFQEGDWLTQIRLGRSVCSHGDHYSQGAGRGEPHGQCGHLASCCGAGTTHEVRKGKDRQGLEETTSTELGRSFRKEQ